MRKKLTRRKFLESSLRGSLMMGGGAMARFNPGTLEARPQKTKSRPSSTLDAGARETLRAAMDEIIPAMDGMPAASAVGSLEYLEGLFRQTPRLKQEFETGLSALDALSQKRFRKHFLKLSRAERVETLKELEKQPALNFFPALRDYVYEAYYTRPGVWKLIGYDFYPTNEAGPRMKPFDEAVLSEVRKKPKLYREVP